MAKSEMYKLGRTIILRPEDFNTEDPTSTSASIVKALFGDKDEDGNWARESVEMIIEAIENNPDHMPLRADGKFK